MPTLTCSIPRALEVALADRAKTTGQSICQLVSKGLSHLLEVRLHTLFEVSTTGALVKGVYEGIVSANLLKQHGTFGLGTFENLSGEMVILEGRIYQAKADGTVLEVPGALNVPFALVTRFECDQSGEIREVESLEELAAQCDRYRESDNLFYAFRIDGRFKRIHTRVLNATSKPLAQAARVQPEFEFRDIDGTLVGIWSPQFSSAFSVPGYHFHFLSDDRTKGGHLLECAGSKLRVQMEKLNEFHVSLPESEEFLKADLSKDSSAELSSAEGLHR
jgi:acetolactate decarboxylase